MIRLKGFARKTRRLTKGGSMPPSSRDSARESMPDRPADPESVMGNNGHQNNGHQNNGHQNGNGTTASDRTEISDRLPAAASDRPDQSAQPNGDRVRSYLRQIVEQVVESRPPIEGRPPLDDYGVHGADEWQGNGRLETVFARASSDVHAAGKIPRWKRVFDISFVLVTLPIWLPLLLAVMLWIKLVSPGPIFYRQERVGYRRRRFMIFKFRTMYVNAETRSHEEYFAHLMNTDRPMTKLDALEDTRLIRCGRLLRASGLDELPQLFNVLFGHMSLVGPRPCLPNEFARYTPAQQERVNAPPGLTGYWQVNGKNNTTFSQMIAMDIYYSKHMSVWLDLGIILKTIPALVSQTLGARSASLKRMEGLAGPALDGSVRKI